MFCVILLKIVLNVVNEFFDNLIVSYYRVITDKLIRLQETIYALTNPLNFNAIDTTTILAVECLL